MHAYTDWSIGKQWKWFKCKNKHATWFLFLCTASFVDAYASSALFVFLSPKCCSRWSSCFPERTQIFIQKFHDYSKKLEAVSPSCKPKAIDWVPWIGNKQKNRQRATCRTFLPRKTTDTCKISVNWTSPAAFWTFWLLVSTRQQKYSKKCCKKEVEHQTERFLFLHEECGSLQRPHRIGIKRKKSRCFTQGSFYSSLQTEFSWDFACLRVPSADTWYEVVDLTLVKNCGRGRQLGCGELMKDGPAHFSTSTGGLDFSWCIFGWRRDENRTWCCDVGAPL